MNQLLSDGGARSKKSATVKRVRFLQLRSGAPSSPPGERATRRNGLSDSGAPSRRKSPRIGYHDRPRPLDWMEESYQEASNAFLQSCPFSRRFRRTFWNCATLEPLGNRRMTQALSFKSLRESLRGRISWRKYSMVQYTRYMKREQHGDVLAMMLARFVSFRGCPPASPSP